MRVVGLPGKTWRAEAFNVTDVDVALETCDDAGQAISCRSCSTTRDNHVRDRMDADMCRIEVADRYPDSHDGTVARNRGEQDADGVCNSQAARSRSTIVDDSMRKLPCPRSSSRLCRNLRHLPCVNPRRFGPSSGLHPPDNVGSRGASSGIGLGWFLISSETIVHRTPWRRPTADLGLAGLSVREPVRRHRPERTRTPAPT